MTANVQRILINLSCFLIICAWWKWKRSQDFLKMSIEKIKFICKYKLKTSEKSFIQWVLTHCVMKNACYNGLKPIGIGIFLSFLEEI